MFGVTSSVTLRKGGFDQLGRDVRRLLLLELRRLAQPIYQKLYDDAVRRFEQALAQEVPVRSGLLRRSLRVRVDKQGRFYITSNVKYAWAVAARTGFLRRAFRRAGIKGLRRVVGVGRTITRDRYGPLGIKVPIRLR